MISFHVPRRLVGLLAPLALVATTASAGVVTAKFSIDKAPPSMVSITGVPGLFGGEQFLHTVEVDGVTITWAYTVKVDALQNRILGGTTTVINATTAPVTVESVVETELDAPLAIDVATGGTVSVKLVTDADGGSLTSGDGPAVVMPVSDNGALGAFFYSPFLMSFSGMSSGSTSALWGLPIPSAPTDTIVGALGHQVSIGLTQGDKAILTIFFAANGDVVAGPPSLLAKSME